METIRFFLKEKSENFHISILNEIGTWGGLGPPKINFFRNSHISVLTRIGTWGPQNVNNLNFFKMKLYKIPTYQF